MLYVVCCNYALFLTPIVHSIPKVVDFHKGHSPNSLSRQDSPSLPFGFGADKVGDNAGESLRETCNAYSGRNTKPLTKSKKSEEYLHIGIPALGEGG